MVFLYTSEVIKMGNLKRVVATNFSRRARYYRRTGSANRPSTINKIFNPLVKNPVAAYGGFTHPIFTAGIQTVAGQPPTVLPILAGRARPTAVDVSFVAVHYLVIACYLFWQTFPAQTPLAHCPFELQISPTSHLRHPKLPQAPVQSGSTGGEPDTLPTNNTTIKNPISFRIFHLFF